MFLFLFIVFILLRFTCLMETSFILNLTRPNNKITYNYSLKLIHYKISTPKLVYCRKIGAYTKLKKNTKTVKTLKLKRWKFQGADTLYRRVRCTVQKTLFIFYDSSIQHAGEPSTFQWVLILAFYSVFYNLQKSRESFAAGIDFQLAKIHPSRPVRRLLFYNKSCWRGIGWTVDCHPSWGQCYIRILPAEWIGSSHWRLDCRGCVGHPNDEVVHSIIWNIWTIRVRYFMCFPAFNIQEPAFSYYTACRKYTTVYKSFFSLCSYMTGWPIEQRKKTTFVCILQIWLFFRRIVQCTSSWFQKFKILNLK